MECEQGAAHGRCSLAPLLVIAIAIAGMVFGREAAQNQIVNEIKDLIGPNGAQAVVGMMQSTAKQSSNIVAAIIGVLVLCWGSTQVLVELQDDLNTIWEVQTKPDQPVKTLLRTRIFSFSMVLAVGFLLLVSLVVSAILSALGALVTALLFTIGKYRIGLYLGKASVSSAYGAAGSLVVVLIWVNFSAQIFFFGAEFGKVYAYRQHRFIPPKQYAMRLSPLDQLKQGIAHSGQDSPRK